MGNALLSVINRMIILAQFLNQSILLADILK